MSKSKAGKCSQAAFLDKGPDLDSPDELSLAVSSQAHMNGNLKLVLKLPKSLQVNSRAPGSSATAEQSKKRRQPEEAGISQGLKQASSHKEHEGQEPPGGAARPPKKLKPAAGPRPPADIADGRPPGQAPVKKRLHIT